MLLYENGLPYSNRKIRSERREEISFRIQDLKDEIQALTVEADEIRQKELSALLNLLPGDFLYAWFKDSEVLCRVSSFSWNEGLDSPEILVHLYRTGLKPGQLVKIFPEDVTIRFNSTSSAKTARELLKTFHL